MSNEHLLELTGVRQIWHNLDISYFFYYTVSLIINIYMALLFEKSSRRSFQNLC